MNEIKKRGTCIHSVVITQQSILTPYCHAFKDMTPMAMNIFNLRDWFIKRIGR